MGRRDRAGVGKTSTEVEVRFGENTMWAESWEQPWHGLTGCIKCWDKARKALVL